MNTSEKERLNFNVSRFDHYYDTINNKIAVYIAINTFLLGGVLGAYLTIKGKIVNFECVFEFLVVLFTFIGLITIAVLIYSSVPFLNYKSSSLYYFLTISQNSLEEYKKKVKRGTKKMI
ncbi:hypothetical protein [Flavobacterium ginsengisoli]|uniref:hypothetical protein n=1 Tax=Flavobacterium ginsengisoli TaxID=871694 RepID=UPI0024151C6E|nr:hypothetical protein [Flavobacterium ginsengisoli]